MRVDAAPVAESLQHTAHSNQHTRQPAGSSKKAVRGGGSGMCACVCVCDCVCVCVCACACVPGCACEHA